MTPTILVNRCHHFHQSQTPFSIFNLVKIDMNSPILSEKAKGKQRASELSDEGGPAPPEELKSLVIRFTEGVPDLTLHIGERDTIKDVKRAVCFRMLSHDGLPNVH